MSTKLVIVFVIFGVLLGPTLYVFSRAQALNARFARISIGDPVETVRGVMGPPRSEERVHLYLKAQIEYRYWVWPVPTVWVVGLTDGRVVDKSEMQPP